jgi:hypothetical protein
MKLTLLFQLGQKKKKKKEERKRHFFVNLYFIRKQHIRDSLKKIKNKKGYWCHLYKTSTLFSVVYCSHNINFRFSIVCVREYILHVIMIGFGRRIYEFDLIFDYHTYLPQFSYKHEFHVL